MAIRKEDGQCTITLSIPKDLYEKIERERGLVTRSRWIRHIFETKIVDRKFIEDVIDLHEMGKDVEQIMFSLGLPYEELEE